MLENAAEVDRTAQRKRLTKRPSPARHTLSDEGGQENARGSADRYAADCRACGSRRHADPDVVFAFRSLA
jgi:hypothetical protein